MIPCRDCGTPLSLFADDKFEYGLWYDICPACNDAWWERVRIEEMSYAEWYAEFVAV